MTTNTTLQTILTELNDAFVQDKRNDGTVFWKLKEDAAPWLKAEDDTGNNFIFRVHDALDDRLPDDWVYEKMAELAQKFTEYDFDSVDELRDNYLSEIIDSLVDVYNMDRARWLASHLNNQALCDEAAEEYNFVEQCTIEHGLSISDLMGQGQYLAIDRIAQAMVSEIEAEIEARAIDAT